jgi:1,4-dihydroxy-2-naphthoate octaprenyltransferase
MFLPLLFSTLTYLLGVAISNYLGATFSPLVFLLGLAWVYLTQVSMNLLAEVFRPANEPIRGLFGAERVYLRDRLLLIAVSLLAVAGISAYAIHFIHPIASAALLLFVSSFLIVLAYAIPPIHLVRRGFGEFLLAAHIGYVFPSLGFVLQAGDFHRLLPIAALPVTALAFAYFLILDFPSFADDIKYERLTFLTRLGWQRAVPFHHGLILLAFGLLALAPFVGISVSVLWPAFLALPFAILQIILLHNISLGAPPIWRLLTTLAASLLALTTYLLAFSFYLR